jgi:hypothetical protein
LSPLPLPLSICFVGLGLFTLSHLLANANFLLLFFAFFLLFFRLNHAEPPLLHHGSLTRRNSCRRQTARYPATT